MKQRCDARNPFQSRLFWAAEKRTNERERAPLSLWNGALSICCMEFGTPPTEHLGTELGLKNYRDSLNGTLHTW